MRRYLAIMKILFREDGFEDTKIGPVPEVKVTYHSYQYGIEVTVLSMKMIESTSDLQRDNKCVEELYEENGASTHYEEMVTGMEKPVATKH